MSLEIFRFKVEDIVEIYASKINVKDAFEVIGYDNDINEIFRIDTARIILLLYVQLKFKASFSKELFLEPSLKK